jgi:hypothetical protein
VKYSGSILSGNSATSVGGGIDIFYNATATVTASTLSANSAIDGGGNYNSKSAKLTIQSSVVDNNVAPLGADLYNLGAFTLNDSTVGVIGP